jgi:uncharacterized membrane protein
MNRFVAKIFSWLVSLLHVFFILVMLGILTQYFKNKEQLIQLFGTSAVNDVYVYGILFFIFVFYMITVGLLVTVIAANENLEAIRLKIESIPTYDSHKVSQGSSSNRTEPSL